MKTTINTLRLALRAILYPVRTSARISAHRTVSSGWLMIVAASACILVMTSTPETAEAVPCGKYTACIRYCPDARELLNICEGHSNGCRVRKAACGSWGCGWDVKKITCVYRNGGLLGEEERE